MPSEDYEHSDFENDASKVDLYWRRLIWFDRRNFMILGATKGQGEIESDQGIVSGHAYSVIAAEEF